MGPGPAIAGKDARLVDAGSQLATLLRLVSVTLNGKKSIDVVRD